VSKNRLELWKEFMEKARLSPKPDAPLGVPLQVEIEVVGLVGAGQGSCLILKNGKDVIVIDCGANSANYSGSELTIQKTVSRIVSARPQYIVISHYHFDHVGALVPTLKEFTKMGLALPTIVTTDMTWRLLKKSLVSARFTTDSFSSGSYRHIRHQTSTNKITLLDVNHSVPGSASVWYQGSKNVLYTADFRRMEIPKQLSNIDLLIIDSTGAMRNEPWEDNEVLAQKTIMDLAVETFARDSMANVYVALFSTQLCRAVALEQAVKNLTGCFPKLYGRALFQSLQAFRAHVPGNTTERFNLVTGVWAQGEGDYSCSEESALVKLSNGAIHGTRLKPGDMVILSGSIPAWSEELMAQINSMCKRIHEIGVQVVIDSSFPRVEGSFARRAKVHCAGHGNLPEIVSVISAVSTTSPNLHVMPFHGREDALNKVAENCQGRGINVIPACQGLVITL